MTRHLHLLHPLASCLIEGNRFCRWDIAELFCFVLMLYVCIDLTACPTHGVREFQMPNTSLTSVKTGDRGATHGKVKKLNYCVFQVNVLSSTTNCTNVESMTWSFSQDMSGLFLYVDTGALHLSWPCTLMRYNSNKCFSSNCIQLYLHRIHGVCLCCVSVQEIWVAIVRNWKERSSVLALTPQSKSLVGRWSC